MEDDKEWDKCLEEAAQTAMPRQLRQLFAFLCIFCNPQSPRKLWEKYKSELSEDYMLAAAGKDDIEKKGNAINCCLFEIESLLTAHGLTCELLNLPSPNLNKLTQINTKTDSKKLKKDAVTTAQNRIKTFNKEQKAVFETIIKAIENRQSKQSHSFYIDGPGGTGKTYLHNTITDYVQGKGGKVLTFATTGN